MNTTRGANASTVRGSDLPANGIIIEYSEDFTVFTPEKILAYANRVCRMSYDALKQYAERIWLFLSDSKYQTNCILCEEFLGLQGKPWPTHGYTIDDQSLDRLNALFLIVMGILRTPSLFRKPTEDVKSEQLEEYPFFLYFELYSRENAANIDWERVIRILDDFQGRHHQMGFDPTLGEFFEVVASRRVATLPARLTSDQDLDAPRPISAGVAPILARSRMATVQITTDTIPAQGRLVGETENDQPTNVFYVASLHANAENHRIAVDPRQISSIKGLVREPGTQIRLVYNPLAGRMEEGLGGLDRPEVLNEEEYMSDRIVPVRPRVESLVKFCPWLFWQKWMTTFLPLRSCMEDTRQYAALAPEPILKFIPDNSEKARLVSAAVYLRLSHKTKVTTKIETMCWACNEQPCEPFLCEDCGIAVYCGEACQLKDFPYHHTWCQRLGRADYPCWGGIPDAMDNCFINSGLQVVLGMPTFRKVCLSNAGRSKRRNDPFFNELVKMFKDLYVGLVVRPSTVETLMKYILTECERREVGGDAVQVIGTIIEHANTALRSGIEASHRNYEPRFKNCNGDLSKCFWTWWKKLAAWHNNPVFDDLYGANLTVMRCESCSEETRTFEVANTLGLALPTNDVRYGVPFRCVFFPLPAGSTCIGTWITMDVDQTREELYMRLGESFGISPDRLLAVRKMNNQEITQSNTIGLYASQLICPPEMSLEIRHSIAEERERRLAQTASADLWSQDNDWSQYRCLDDRGRYENSCMFVYELDHPIVYNEAVAAVEGSDKWYGVPPRYDVSTQTWVDTRVPEGFVKQYVPAMASVFCISKVHNIVEVTEDLCHARERVGYSSISYDNGVAQSLAEHGVPQWFGTETGGIRLPALIVVPRLATKAQLGAALHKFADEVAERSIFRLDQEFFRAPTLAVSMLERGFIDEERADCKPLWNVKPRVGPTLALPIETHKPRHRKTEIDTEKMLDEAYRNAPRGTDPFEHADNVQMYCEVYCRERHARAQRRELPAVERSANHPMAQAEARLAAAVDAAEQSPFNLEGSDHTDSRLVDADTSRPRAAPLPSRASSLSHQSSVATASEAGVSRDNDRVKRSRRRHSGRGSVHTVAAPLERKAASLVTDKPAEQSPIRPRVTPGVCGTTTADDSNPGRHNLQPGGAVLIGESVRERETKRLTKMSRLSSFISGRRRRDLFDLNSPDLAVRTHLSPKSWRDLIPNFFSNGSPLSAGDLTGAVSRKNVRTRTGRSSPKPSSTGPKPDLRVRYARILDACPKVAEEKEEEQQGPWKLPGVSLFKTPVHYLVEEISNDTLGLFYTTHFHDLLNNELKKELMPRAVARQRFALEENAKRLETGAISVPGQKCLYFHGDILRNVHDKRNRLDAKLVLDPNLRMGPVGWELKGVESLAAFLLDPTGLMKSGRGTLMPSDSSMALINPSCYKELSIALDKVTNGVRLSFGPARLYGFELTHSGVIHPNLFLHYSDFVHGVAAAIPKPRPDPLSLPIALYWAGETYGETAYCRCSKEPVSVLRSTRPWYFSDCLTIQLGRTDEEGRIHHQAVLVPPRLHLRTPVCPTKCYYLRSVVFYQARDDGSMAHYTTLVEYPGKLIDATKAETTVPVWRLYDDNLVREFDFKEAMKLINDCPDLVYLVTYSAEERPV